MTLLTSACLQVLEDFGATSLQAYLRGGRLGLHDVLRVGIAVASALDHVHAGGLLHLDVSRTLLDDSCQTFLRASGACSPHVEAGSILKCSLHCSIEVRILE
jgi:hypothetical protein